MAKFVSNTSTLLDVRKNFINASGRVDLVSDLTNYTDNGADYLIQRASDYLDFKYLNHKSVQRYQYDILSGEYFHQIPNLIGIKDMGNDHEGGVWLSNGDGRSRLTQASIGWMRSEIGSPVADLDTDAPKYYALVHSHLAESQLGLRKYESSPTSFNGDFDDDSTWVIATGFSIADGKMTNDGINAGAAIHASAVTSGKTYLVEFEILDMTDGTLTIALGTESYEISDNGKYRTEITADGTSVSITCSSDFDGSIDNILLKRVSNEYVREFTYDFEDVQFAEGTDLTSMYKNAGLFIMYPSDARYTVTVFGYFRSNRLTSDTSVNFWTVNHPDALLQATLYYLELTHRNTAGQNDALNGLRTIMDPVEKAHILATTNYRWLD